ncbi:MAG: helix-turn-helix domain-containing protein [Clostridia bacterium]|nr:helix-turn-helix domain-containing protein [Clostridia bacterium]
MKREEAKLLVAEEFIGATESFSCECRKCIYNFDLHWHDFCEIEVVTSGTGTQILNGREYTVSRGTVYMLSPLDFHSGVTDGEIELYNLMFHESLLPEELLRAVYTGKDRLLQFPPQEFEEIVSLCRLLETEYGKREQYREDILKNLLECLVALVLRKLPPTEQTETAETGDIKRAVLYIQRHFKESPALSEVAKTVNLHPNYFSQKFREETGESFTAYITEQKISYAKKLLLCSDLTVTEICFASGFCSLSNFMKVFKKAVGVPPLQYVQQQKTVCR